MRKLTTKEAMDLYCHAYKLAEEDVSDKETAPPAKQKPLDVQKELFADNAPDAPEVPGKRRGVADILLGVQEKSVPDRSTWQKYKDTITRTPPPKNRSNSLLLDFADLSSGGHIDEQDRLRRNQALAIGGTALGVGVLGAGSVLAYKALKKRLEKKNKKQSR